MRRNRAGKVLTVIAFATLFAAAFGYIVMRLWNWLMPGLFGLHSIGLWQAVGILALSKILFGGFHGRHGGSRWRHRMHERWGHMTPEQREKFRDTVRSRWGSFDPPAEAPKA